MTNSATQRALSPARRAAMLRRLVSAPMIVALSSVLVLVGVVGALADEVRLVLVAVLLLQGCLIALVLTQRIAVGRLEDALSRRIDQASARQLADLARTRHALAPNATSDPEELR